MSSRFETAVLGSSLFYPNAVVWSDENLVAVAAGATVVIMNPSNPGVRGIISIASTNPFPVGVIDGEKGLLDGCLLAHNLSRDARPCVRSISWSPVGLSNDASSLISICTAGGRVKLYRPPFCEFSAEWIEVVDVSEMLFDYLKKTNFGECDLAFSDNMQVSRILPLAVPRQYNVGSESTDDLQACSLNRKRSRRNAASGEPLKKKKNDDSHFPLVTAKQYATRNEMLMSLVVAWSPIAKTSQCSVAAVPDNSCCSFLAVGGKCGRISLWKVNAPRQYSIDNPDYLGKVSLVGLFKAHDAWITAIDWAASSGSGVSHSHFLLATGSSDGSVKIWQVDVAEHLNPSSEVMRGSLPLIKEVITVDSAAVSAIAICVHPQPPWKLSLAIGKGSGDFDVWIGDKAVGRFENVGTSCPAHDCIVTGLAWAFDGCCLYSCSQDNSVKGWSVVGNILSEVPLPTTALGVQSFREDHYVFESCFGLAISPGNLAMAVARRFDADLLHPMYEGRSHRAAVEFLWIGGQQFHSNSVPDSPERESISWESNMLWSLNRYNDSSKILNPWDAVSALLAFKVSAPVEFLERFLSRWLASSRLEFQPETPSSVLSKASDFLPELSTRQLQLIGVLGRRVVLGDDDSREEERAKLWRELLSSVENELAERLLLGITFSAVLNDPSGDGVETGKLSPDGWELMVQHYAKKGRSDVLAEQARRLEKRYPVIKIPHSFFLKPSLTRGLFFCFVSSRRLLHDHDSDERCVFCSAAVPFESKEYATCSGVERHRLERCSVSMRILPAGPSWYCMCCGRRAAEPCPAVLFAMMDKSGGGGSSTTPCCLFCGILLQRSRPEYGLS
ncbi:hypothetical protein M569_06831, partial [Genlisea aurea]